MPGAFDEIIFGKTSFGDLLKEIHKKSNEKEKLILDLVQQLKDMIDTLGDAVMMVPLIKSYMDLSMTANDHLIKMAAIVQKAVDRKSTDGGESGGLTDEERNNLKMLSQEALGLQISTEQIKKQIEA